MPLPALTTERLVLRPATSADTDRLWQHWIHPDVRRYMFDDRAMPREEAEAWIVEQETFAARGLGAWVIETSEGGFVGHICLVDVHDLEPAYQGDVEFGIALAPEAWGRGYAAEALRAVLAHSTGTAGLTRILGVYDVPNLTSRKLQEEAGFVRLGETQGPVHRLVISAYSAA